MSAITAPMRHLIIFCAVFICCACQTAQTVPPLTESPALADLARQRAEFLNREDVSEALERLRELEQQALQLVPDEPLKLGSLGSAILDIYPGSHTGHYVLARFYEHVESTDARQQHEQALENLQQAMQTSGDGTQRSPYTVMTMYDAHTFAKTRDASPVGAIYQSSGQAALGYLLIARPDDGPLQQSFFDLSHLLELWQLGQAQSDIHANPWAYIRSIARSDGAAQTAIGAYLTSAEKDEDAIGWLKAAARTDNVLANRMLARIYWSQAEESTDEARKAELQELSLENHLHAIALGSTDSMYTLASMYFNDVYGQDNRQAGIALLKQAADLQHAESLIYLGHLHNIGKYVEQDTEQAGQYFARAAALNKPQAVLNYGRYLINANSNEAFVNHNEIHEWLESLADEGNAEAMIILGNLHARGIGTKASSSRAVRWYKQAVREASNDPDVVNEVAWTLTVSDIDGLKRIRYASRIMSRMMNAREQARSRPEFLDTWAAVFAAKGDFTQAIELQKQAIANATKQDREDVLDILQQHLELFKAGASITEKAP